jgi:serine/threonine-protein kinase
MDSKVANKLLTALRGSGQYTAEQVAAAHRALTSGDMADVAVAERLNAAGVLTSYQYRKIRIGRTEEVLFGNYLLLDKVGEGGMGKVYRAVQVTTQRMVALKVVRPQLMSNTTVRKRYAREARAAAAIDHPNVVSLFETDEIDGRCFLAMEYVDGIDLSRLMKAFGNPPQSGLPNYQEACEYVYQAALGLAHAHSRGLIHRDIKPSNILVSGERALPGTPGKAVVKLLDMGLVRSIMESDEYTGTELTRDGTVVGTPDYMAPEQAKNSSTVDPRADLYALGCTLFFLLRGRPPFPDGSPIDKLLRHQLDPPPDLRALRPDVPPGVVAVVDRLMKKNPAERYQSATEVANALRPYTQTGEAHRAAFGEPQPDNPFDFSFTPPVATTGLPAAPAAPAQTASGGVRLRIAQPGQTSGAAPNPAPRPAAKPPAAVNPAAKVPTPLAAPRAEPSPSEDSLPTSRPATPAATARPAPKTATPSPKGTARGLLGTETSPLTPTNMRRARRNRRRQQGMQVWVIATAVGIGALVLLVVMLIISRVRREQPTTQGLTSGTTVAVSRG